MVGVCQLGTVKTVGEVGGEGVGRVTGIGAMPGGGERTEREPRGPGLEKARPLRVGRCRRSGAGDAP